MTLNELKEKIDKLVLNEKGELHVAEYNSGIGLVEIKIESSAFLQAIAYLRFSKQLSPVHKPVENQEDKD